MSVVLAFAVACGGATVQIKTQQDYENVVVDLVKQVIDTFKADGMNCDVLSHDLHGIADSQKFTAAKSWKEQHPDAQQQVAPKVQPFREDFEKAATPGLHACGATLEQSFATLTQ